MLCAIAYLSQVGSSNNFCFKILKAGTNRARCLLKGGGGWQGVDCSAVLGILQGQLVAAELRT